MGNVPGFADAILDPRLQRDIGRRPESQTDGRDIGLGFQRSRTHIADPPIFRYPMTTDPRPNGYPPHSRIF